MEIIPAIDLMNGKCVRLIQGNYDRKINYEDDPVKQARQFSAAGAKWLHIVDLDGAKAGKPVNTETIANIAKLNLFKIEVGGGLRDEKSIKQLLDIGATRAIIGTKAVSDFEWFSRICKKFPNRIALGLDAKGSNIATQGWTQDSPESLLDFAKKAANLLIAAIIYTDISKDGMMAGPNLERTKALIDSVNVPIVASGGITTVEDIKSLIKIGAPAAIIGRALYEGTLNLATAIKTAQP